MNTNPAQSSSFLQASTGETITLELIDADAASAYLATNIDHNRKVKDGQVKKYAEMMTKDSWPFIGSPIVIDANGRLIDGQHRLLAVVKADAIMEVAVVRGCATEAIEAIDSGIVRDASATLTVSGFSNPQQRAALAKLLIARELGRTSTSGMYFSNARVVQFCRDNNLDEALTLQNIRGSLPMNPTALNALFHICSQIDADAAEEFWRTQVCRSIGLAEGSPALAFRDRIEKEARGSSRTRQGRSEVRDQIGFGIQAWNHFRTGRSIKSLTRPTGGFTSANYPVPA